MKIIDMGRQGECLFIQVEKFEDDRDYREVSPEGGHLIVGHSETGHHHVIDVTRSPNAQLLIDQTNALAGRLVLGEAVEIEHLRSFDTHLPVHLPKGNHIVRWRREWAPEGMRRVMD